MTRFLFVDHPGELARLPRGAQAFGLDPEGNDAELARQCSLGVLRGGRASAGQIYGLAMDALSLSASSGHPLFTAARETPDQVWLVSASRTLETMVTMLIVNDLLRPDPVLFPRPNTRAEREAELFECRDRDPSGILGRIRMVDESARFLRGEVTVWPGMQDGFRNGSGWLKHGIPSDVMELAGPDQLVQWCANRTFPEDRVMAALHEWLKNGTRDVGNPSPFSEAAASIREDALSLLRCAAEHAADKRAQLMQRLMRCGLHYIFMGNGKAALMNLAPIDKLVPPDFLVRAGFCAAPVIAFIHDENGSRRYVVASFHATYFDQEAFLRHINALETSGGTWRLTHPREPLGNALVSPDDRASTVPFTKFLALVEACCR